MENVLEYIRKLRKCFFQSQMREISKFWKKWYILEEILWLISGEGGITCMNFLNFDCWASAEII